MNPLRRLWLHPAAAWLARAVLAAIFLLAAWPKLAAPDTFATAVYAYHLLPERIIGLFAVGLPGVELAAVGGLIWRRTRPAAELLLSLMLLMFIAAASVALARGLAGIDCGCFGPGHTRGLGTELLLEDTALLALALCALVQSYHRQVGAQVPTHA